MIEKINYLQCKGCGRCVQICPQHVLTLQDGHVSIENRDRCTSCGLCVSKCVWGAITLDGLEPQNVSTSIALSGRTPEVLYLTCYRGVVPELVQETILQVPCLQAVGKFLLQEFLQVGLDGIAVCPCMDQQCMRHEKDNAILLADWQKYFSSQFLEPQRIQYCKSSQEILDFCEQLQKSTPNSYSV